MANLRKRKSVEKQAEVYLDALHDKVPVSMRPYVKMITPAVQGFVL